MRSLTACSDTLAVPPGQDTRTHESGLKPLTPTFLTFLPTVLEAMDGFTITMPALNSNLSYLSYRTHYRTYRSYHTSTRYLPNTANASPFRQVYKMPMSKPLRHSEKMRLA